MPVALAFLVALLVATVLGSVVQTQVNLASLSALGVAVSVGTRLAATVHDLARFAPFFALLVAPLLAAGIGVASLAARIWPRYGSTLTIVMPALLMFALLTVVLAVPAMPAVIAAARDVTGMLLISLAMAGGAWVWVKCTGRLR